MTKKPLSIGFGLFLWVILPRKFGENTGKTRKKSEKMREQRANVEIGKLT